MMLEVHIERERAILRDSQTRRWSEGHRIEAAEQLCRKASEKDAKRIVQTVIEVLQDNKTSDKLKEVCLDVLYHHSSPDNIGVEYLVRRLYHHPSEISPEYTSDGPRGFGTKTITKTIYVTPVEDWEFEHAFNILGRVFWKNQSFKSNIIDGKTIQDHYSTFNEWLINRIDEEEEEEEEEEEGPKCLECRGSMGHLGGDSEDGEIEKWQCLDDECDTKVVGDGYEWWKVAK